MRVVTLKAVVISITVLVVATLLALVQATWVKSAVIVLLLGIRYALRLGLRRWQARIAAFWTRVDARGLVAADVQALAGRYAVAQWQASRPECARFLSRPAVLHRVLVRLDE